MINMDRGFNEDLSVNWTGPRKNTSFITIRGRSWLRQLVVDPVTEVWM